MNLLQFAAVLSALGIAGFVPMQIAQGSDLAEEYNQVKKIALRDPKVRAAFEKANSELDKRIIEIDPSLKPFIEKQRGTKKKTLPAKGSDARTHIVAKGETLTSLARRYRVSVNSLVQANHISKQATLRVGQKLVIPTEG
jgi:LysM domain